MLAEIRDALRTADDLLTGAVRDADPGRALRAVGILDAALPLVQMTAEKLDPADASTDLWPAPKRELSHPDARALTACPFCGAALGQDDRTFTGSFCEACGTRWSEGPDGARPQP
jgi:hypothetical protein